MEYFLQYSTRLTKVNAHYHKQAIFPGKGSRGEIKEFSSRSRKRLFEKMLELDIVRDGAFLTLTFPDWLEKEKEKYKRCFEVMRKHIEKKGSAVWKLEFTRNEVPHYHVLIDCDFKREDRDVIRNRWTKIVVRNFACSHELKRRDIGFIRTSYDRVRNKAAFAFYFSYYFAGNKEYQNNLPDWFRGGSRLWGVWGDWKKVDSSCIKITKKEYEQITEKITELIKAKKPSYYNKGFKYVYYGDLLVAKEIMEFNRIIESLIHDCKATEVEAELPAEAKLTVEDEAGYYDRYGNWRVLSRGVPFDRVGKGWKLRIVPINLPKMLDKKYTAW